MKQMKEIKDEDIFLNPKYENKIVYEKRVTVKAIVKNKNDNYAFITNKIHNYVLLPGGGAESTDLEKEVDRECKEEIFFSIKSIKKLFEIKEFRNREAREYKTICFFAEADKSSKIDTRTIEEKNNDLSVVWLSENEALKRMKKQIDDLKQGKVKFYNIAFNILRDYRFFEEYIKYEKEQ